MTARRCHFQSIYGCKGQINFGYLLILRVRNVPSEDEENKHMRIIGRGETSKAMLLRLYNISNRTSLLKIYAALLKI